MQSQNYDPDLSYLAVRFDSFKSGYNNISVWCCGVKPAILDKEKESLLALQAADLDDDDVIYYLKEIGAVRRDFNDTVLDLTYPGEILYDMETDRIQKMAFYGKDGWNDPARNFPAKIQLFDAKPEITFYQKRQKVKHLPVFGFNGEVNNCARGRGYDDLIACVRHPEEFITYPELPKKHAVIILKDG